MKLVGFVRAAQTLKFVEHSVKNDHSEIKNEWVFPSGSRGEIWKIENGNPDSGYILKYNELQAYYNRNPLVISEESNNHFIKEETVTCNKCGNLYSINQHQTTQISQSWGYFSTGKDGITDHWNLCQKCLTEFLSDSVLVCSKCHKTLLEVAAYLDSENPHCKYYLNYSEALKFYLEEKNYLEFANIKDQIVCEICYEKYVQSFKIPIKMENYFLKGPLDEDEEPITVEISTPQLREWDGVFSKLNENNELPESKIIGELAKHLVAIHQEKEEKKIDRIQEAFNYVITGDSSRKFFEFRLKREEILSIFKMEDRQERIIQIESRIINQDYRDLLKDVITFKTGSKEYLEISCEEILNKNIDMFELAKAKNPEIDFKKLHLSSDGGIVKFDDDLEISSSYLIKISKEYMDKILND